MRTSTLDRLIADPSPRAFDALQRDWQLAADALCDRRSELDQRYQSSRYAPARERKALDALYRREAAACDRFMAWLARHSPRDWSQRIPCAWIRVTLTYADAVTDAALSTVPPCAYGTLPDDLRRFAAPISGRPQPAPADAGSAGIVVLLALALALTGTVAAGAAFGAASHAWIVISYAVAVGLAVVLRRKAGI